MLRLRVLLRETVRTWIWTGEPLRLGSAPDNDVVIDDPAVSRHHAVVEPDAEGRGVWLVDSGSKNGILVRGETLRRALLLPGVAAGIGHAQVQLEELPADELDLAIELPEAPRPPWHPSSTADLTPALDDEPARALELVLEIGKTPQDRWAARERELLERTRLLTWAETILVGSLSAKDRLALRLLVGRPLDEADSELLYAALGRARTSERAHSDGRILVIREETGRFLAALFARPGSPSRLRVALLEKLARAALAEPSTERERAAQGRRRRASIELELPPGYVLGTSAAAQELEREIRLAIEHSGPALILGEPGVGKEAVAWILHHSGPRASGPLRVVDATRLRGELAAPELFGIEKGVATSVERRVGAYSLARGGSVFLDEIGDLEWNAQSLLLRVLQEGRFVSVGGRDEQVADARTLAATNHDLEARVHAGTFRRDLLSRLEAAVVRVPRLIDRMDDLQAILTAMLQGICVRKNRHLRGISRAALDGLATLPWPGNFRQLRNEVESAVDATPDGATLESRNFARLRGAAVARSRPVLLVEMEAPPTAQGPTLTSLASLAAAPALLPVALETEELLRRRTLEALETCRGNKSQAANRMGVSRSTFYEYLKRFGLST
jgi:DNA-binding NtrC family response regulator